MTRSTNPADASRIHGLVTALVTPLTREGGLDEPGLERLVERQAGAGVDAIFVLGSVGEGPLVSDAVYRKTAQRAAALSAGRCLLLGGASDNSLERCLARLDVLADAGVELGVLTLPFYGWPSEPAHAVRFFSEVASRSPIPIVAYNLPKAVGMQIPPDVLEALFQIPNIAGIKDTHADFDAMAHVASSPLRPPGFSYLPGNTSFAARLLERGADGVVCTPANVFPEPFAALIRHHREGRGDVVRRIDAELVPKLTRLLQFQPTGAASIKGFLEADAVCGRHTVRPWPEMDASGIPACRTALAEMREAIGAFDPAAPTRS